MAINTGNFGRALWPGINAWFGDEYNAYDTKYDKMFSSHQSRMRWEEDVYMSQFGLAPEKPEGSPIAYDTAQQGFTSRYTNVTYGTGFIITEEMVEDDLYDVIGERNARALARSMRVTKETVGANVYNRAFNGSYVGGDNVSLLNTSHPNVAGGTWSNTLATAADLSEASLEQACIDIMKWEDDRGLPVQIMPKTLVLPVDEVFNAERILKSNLRVSTADNDINALNSMGKFSDVLSNVYLTDPDAWFIRTDCPDGLKYFERKGDTFAMDNDFDTSNYKYKATGRYSFGWSDPRGLFGSEGSGA